MSRMFQTSAEHDIAKELDHNGRNPNVVVRRTEDGWQISAGRFGHAGFKTKSAANDVLRAARVIARQRRGDN